jgi:hypothetical protein
VLTSTLTGAGLAQLEETVADLVLGGKVSKWESLANFVLESKIPEGTGEEICSHPIDQRENS